MPTRTLSQIMSTHYCFIAICIKCMYILLWLDYVQELEKQVAKLREQFPTYSKAKELSKDAPTCLTGDLTSLDKETLVHNRQCRFNKH